MRRTSRISLGFVCACLLYSCAEPTLECGTDQVKGTLASIVREHFLRVALDTYAFSFDVEKKARFTRAVRVTARDARLVAWDKAIGRLTCAAKVVIEAPVPEDRSTTTGGAELVYRVTGGEEGRFFVEVAFADLVVLVANRTRQVPESRPVL